MNNLELSLTGVEVPLDVRRFSVNEALSALFSVDVWAMSAQGDLDLDAIVGRAASLHIHPGALQGSGRAWSGICAFMEQVHAEPTGLSTYHMRVVPKLWLLTQRRNHRVYQHLSIPDITDKLLGEWGVDFEWRIDEGAYPKLEYKVQYGESDFAFLSRLWEEAGIAFAFDDGEQAGTKLVLGDKLHDASVRVGPPLLYVDHPSNAGDSAFVTQVHLTCDVRPGAYTIRDFDFRNPTYALFGDASGAPSPEDRYEQYHYQPGAFLIETDKGGGGTPAADIQGIARHEEPFGDGRAARALAAIRAGKRAVSFSTNAVDLRPGTIFQIDHHPHTELSSNARLLVASFHLSGEVGTDWTMSGRALFADVPYRPMLTSPRPEVSGVQTATVVGPAGQEIHTDEFGRVRVQFPWDREGQHDDHSSCWIRVSQGWAGTGFGMITIPRIGQEVLVGFLEGDPDQPVVVGRVYNQVEQVPYKLPQHKTRSTWKSDSSIGSGGFNEIMFEDLKGKELVYMQAQKNLRKLVKHNETITVGHNRQKLVLMNETETTGMNRTEVTGVDRTEITGVNRTTIVGAHKTKLVKGDETEKTDGNLTIYVGKDQDIVVKADKRDRVEGDSHLHVKGHRKQKIDKSQSLTVGQDQQEKVGKSHALDAGQQIHLKAGTALVIEAASDLTIKGPGGFIRIDAGGVTIRGHVVKINSGGSAGSGAGASPEEPDPAIEAEVIPPLAPTPDNVAITGLLQ
ncbi:MAG: type VI secretion system tip protein TssI/VgrG [Byssovorax sp.]